MSVFEQKILAKVHVDETEVMTAVIINSENIEGHIEYVIRVHRGFCEESKWYVKRRYNDFLALHQSFQISSPTLVFPPKKFIGNLKQKFITERKNALQVYMDEILMNPILSVTFELKKFLDPLNYRHTCRESILSDLHIVIRSEMEIKGIKELPQLGWRFRKQSFVVISKDNLKKENIVHWTPFGPDRCLEDQELYSVLKTLTSLQHVNIAKIEKAGICKGGGWIVQDIQAGTLMDTLYSIKDPIYTSAQKKYADISQKATLDVNEVVEIASQILQALAFIHHNNIPYGHLHLGNIFIDGNIIKLLGIENALFGLPSFFRRNIVNCFCLDTLQAVDVYCFGLTLYGMLFVKPFSKTIPETCPPILKNVLECLLTPRALRTGLPSVKDLLNLHIFRRPPPNPQPYFKISQNVLQNLGRPSENTISRIKLDSSKAREQKKAKTVLRLMNDNETLPSLPSTS